MLSVALLVFDSFITSPHHMGMGMGIGMGLSDDNISKPQLHQHLITII